VPNFASVSVKQNQQGYPVQINELINGKYVEEEVPVILSTGSFPMVEVCIMYIVLAFSFQITFILSYPYKCIHIIVSNTGFN